MFAFKKETVLTASLNFIFYELLNFCGPMYIDLPNARIGKKIIAANIIHTVNSLLLPNALANLPLKMIFKTIKVGFTSKNIIVLSI